MLAFVVLTAQAACPSWPTADRFAVSGAEVTDKRTGLVWARCSAGQSWDGSTCSGSASAFTHEQALQYAATQSGWRLPNKRELFSLTDKGCSNPAIDSVAFPNTPSSWYWTSSPYVGYSGSAWYVDFSFGGAWYGGISYSDGRDYSLAVRLVRASQ